RRSRPYPRALARRSARGICAHSKARRFRKVQAPRKALPALRRRRLRASFYGGARGARQGRSDLENAAAAAYPHRRNRRAPRSRRIGCKEEADGLSRRLRAFRARMTAYRPAAAFAFSHPAHFIALGFGAG